MSGVKLFSLTGWQSISHKHIKHNNDSRYTNLPWICIFLLFSFFLWIDTLKQNKKYMYFKHLQSIFNLCMTDCMQVFLCYVQIHVVNFYAKVSIGPFLLMLGTHPGQNKKKCNLNLNPTVLVVHLKCARSWMGSYQRLLNETLY